MKKIAIYTLSVAVLFTACTSQELLQTTNTILNNGNSGQQGLTNDEVISGLREALKVGTNNSSSLASKEDGFFKNERIFLSLQTPSK